MRRLATKVWTMRSPLVEAGNGVTLTNYEGMMHGFFVAGGMLDAARRGRAMGGAARSVRGSRAGFALNTDQRGLEKWQHCKAR